MLINNIHSVNINKIAQIYISPLESGYYRVMIELDTNSVMCYDRFHREDEAMTCYERLILEIEDWI